MFMETVLFVQTNFLPMYGTWRYQALYKLSTLLRASALSTDKSGLTCLTPDLITVPAVEAILLDRKLTSQYCDLNIEGGS